MLTQSELRGKYPVFYSNFTEMHNKFIQEGHGHRGHGPDHDILVAGYTLLIAGDDHRLAEMAWVAAICTQRTSTSRWQVSRRPVHRIAHTHAAWTPPRSRRVLLYTIYEQAYIFFISGAFLQS